jgi:hypothetical protein
MRVLHTISTVETSYDGDDYDGRTFGVSLFGVRVCLFVGRRYRIRTVAEESVRADQLSRAANEVHARWT